MKQLITNNKSKYFLDYFLVVLLFLSADNIILGTSREFKAMLFFLVVFIFHLRKRSYDKQLFFVVIILTLLIIIQGVIWGFSLFTLLTFLAITVLTPYYAIKILGTRFFLIAENLIYVTAIIGLFFYLIQMFVIGGEDFLYWIADLFSDINPLPEVRPNFFLYTISVNYFSFGSNILRNSGPFHEPGAFAVFIVLAIGFNILRNKQLLTKRNVVLSIALITTFSTAGYLSLIALVIAYYTLLSKKKIGGFAILILLVPLFIYISGLPFMTAKIQHQYKSQTEVSLNVTTSGRILGARKSILVLKRYPLTGRGLISASKVEDRSSEEAAGYGFMKFFSQIGIILSLLFLLIFRRGLKRVAFFLGGEEKYWLLIAASLGINLFSQKFIMDNLFIMFFFFGLLPQFSIFHIGKLKTF